MLCYGKLFKPNLGLRKKFFKVIVMKKIYWNFLRLVFGILLLVILFYKLGFAGIYKAISDMNIVQIMIALLISILSIILSAINIKILLLFPDFKIDYKDLIKICSLSWAVGLFFPGRFGEFSIIPLLKKKGLDLEMSATISFIDKLITFLVLSMLTVLAVFIYLPFNQAFNIFIIVLLIVTFKIIIFFTYKGRKLILSLLPKKMRVKFILFSGFLDDFINHGKALILLNFLFTIVKQFVIGFIMYLMLLSFGIDFPFINTLLIISAITIISLIPISISGLGIRESTAVFLFSLAGVNEITVGAIFTILLILRYVIGALIMYFIKI